MRLMRCRSFGRSREPDRRNSKPAPFSSEGSFLAATSNATPSSRLLTLIAIVVVIVGLYFGRQVLIPLALAVVLAFLLAPVVGWLQKCRLGRVPAVLVVLALAFALVSSLGWIVAGQLMDIVDQFPSYRSSIHDKMQSLRVPDGGRFRN